MRSCRRPRRHIAHPAGVTDVVKGGLLDFEHLCGGVVQEDKCAGQQHQQLEKQFFALPSREPSQVPPEMQDSSHQEHCPSDLRSNQPGPSAATINIHITSTSTNRLCRSCPPANQFFAPPLSRILLELLLALPPRDPSQTPEMQGSSHQEQLPLDQRLYQVLTRPFSSTSNRLCTSTSHRRASSSRRRSRPSCRGYDRLRQSEHRMKLMGPWSGRGRCSTGRGFRVVVGI
ncbi:hypothetical protein GALMADRAFT_1249638 [Galerina marginata CBS 339.88]|uniref:Uncharacterized protein n=1 Tax=Galerina marginata (strain CBS 339.88) TaxID=685588 RepID=A0A067T5R0_GALM3|nr:hypothetical protein GALMADRAFT_1249638 [Galerina marginata CBS 339.88]